MSVKYVFLALSIPPFDLFLFAIRNLTRAALGSPVKRAALGDKYYPC